MEKFPIIDSITESFSLTLENFFKLLRAAWFPLLLAGVSLFCGGIGANFIENKAYPEGFVIMAVSVLAATLAFSACAVHWHRLVIEGDERGYEHVSVRTMLRYFWTAIKTVVLPYFIFVLSILMPTYFMFGANAAETSGSATASTVHVGAVIGAMLVIVDIAIFVAVFLYTPRLWIALPDAALGGKGSLRHAWQRTRGNTLRLFVYNFLLGIILALLNVFADKGGNFLEQQQ